MIIGAVTYEGLSQQPLPVFLQPSVCLGSCLSFVVLLECGKEKFMAKLLAPGFAINFISSDFSKSTCFAGKVFLEANNIPEL